MTVMVTGSTGFLGRRVVQALLAEGKDVRCLVHSPGSESLFDLDKVDVHYGSVTDPPSLRSAFYNLDEVIHLVAIIQERGNSTFYRVNVEGVRNVLRAAEAAGVQRIVHVSAIGAQETPTMRYLHSKWQGEQLVLNSGIPYTILRPSLLFGEGDQFMNSLAGLVRAAPVVPVIGSGKNELQPVSVDDVARCIVTSIDEPSMRNRIVEIGGPHRLTYNQIVDTVAKSMGARHLKLRIPVSLMRFPVWLMQKFLSRPPITLEQLAMIQVPNYPQSDTVQKVFGFSPRPLMGNIDFVRRVTRLDGLKMLFGRMPAHLRDH